MARWFKSRRFRLLLIVVFTYSGLWFISVYIGTSQIRHVEVERMNISPLSTDVSREARFGSGPLGGDRAVPYHWCVVRAYIPLVVVTHSGVVRGGLNADGRSTLHLWLLGFVIRVRDFALWTS